ncbi:MAG: hypothetical protein HRU28_05945 [Rhizobiales bacterium]|nr:hypothetical protein [Hyphomicrobiales bacterium]
MVSCPFNLGRLCTAAFRLTLILSSFSSFASYTPPSVGVPLDFFFNSESQAETFSKTQCDSNDFSWAVCQTGVVCAIGDPDNITCIVAMCYFATDVNNCQGSTTDPDIPPDPDNPDPDNPDLVGGFPVVPRHSDIVVDGYGDNSNLLAQLNRENHFLFSGLSRIHDESLKTNAFLYRSNQLLDMISKVRDFGGVVEAIKEAAYDQEYRDILSDEGRVDQKWLLPHITAKRLLDDEILSELKDIALYTDDIGHIKSINSNIDRRLVKIQGYVDTLKDNSSIIKSNSNSIKDSSIASAATLRTIDSALSRSSMMAVSRYDISDQTESLSASLQAITDKTQAQTDEFNARSSELQSLLESIKSNTAGGNSGGGDGGEPDEGDTAIAQACLAFTCTSSSPICYMARKQWELDCANQTALTDSGALGDIKSQITDYINDDDSKLSNIDLGTVDTASLMSKYTSGAGFSAGPATCPAPYIISTIVGDIPLDFKPLCDLAFIVRWFIIASATIGAGMLIAKYS